MAKQFYLFEEEEETLPTWKDIIKDPETLVIIGAIVIFIILSLLVGSTH